MLPLLETIIGLVFVFLAFSLITSWIVEYLSMLYQRRGNMLFKYLKKSLNDDFNKNWGLMLYGHPLIESLGREIPRSGSIFGFLQNNKIGLRKRLPHYIPADQFAAALVDLIIDHPKESYFHKNSLGQYVTVKETFEPNQSYEHFLIGLNSLNESELKNILRSLVRNISNTSSQTDQYLSLLQQIGGWYNNNMDRLNGWYKRATRRWLFITGFFVALFFNVNTITVLVRLYTDPQIRTAVSAAAKQYVSEHQTAPGTEVESMEELKDKINGMRDIIAPLKLPIGYNYREASFKEMSTDYFCAVKKAFPANCFGWLLTALAISFGASFWFDILKGFVNVRSAGIAPKPVNQNSLPKT